MVDDRRLAEVSDPDGREVVLVARIWRDKITRDHPELRDHLAEVLGTVTEPTTSSRTRAWPADATTAGTWAPAAGCSWS